MNWKNIFDKGQELTVSTCSKKHQPNANIVMSLGFIESKLLFADCQMATTINNIKETNAVCIVAKKDNQYLRLIGKANIFSSGKYFDTCQKLSGKDYTVKNAILVDITEIFDLDKVEKINLD